MAISRCVLSACAAVLLTAPFPAMAGAVLQSGAQSGGQSAAPQATPESAAPRAAVEIETAGIEMEIAGPQGPLAGTFLNAGAGTPVVLLLPGSGPTDRDGNNLHGVRAASSRLLAEGLAAEHVSSLRIDKRGLFGSATAISNPNAVTIADYARDAHDWIAALRARTGAPCVWLLGHSEGGLIALFAAQEPEGICGLLLVAAPGRPLDLVLREQLSAAPPAISEQAFAAIDRLKAGGDVDPAGLPPALAGLFARPVQPFLRDLFSHDPAELAAHYAGPILIVQGSEDIQVSTRDAELLHTAARQSQLLVVPGMNHVLKTVPAGDRAANVAAYADPDRPLADGLVGDMAAFIRAHGGQ